MNRAQAIEAAAGLAMMGVGASAYVGWPPVLIVLGFVLVASTALQVVARRWRAGG